MKKIGLFCTFLFLCLAHSAFAIDQVTLTSGEVVEGKVLADVPNRHVDIELVNGTKKRFPYTEVAKVEHDVPSEKDAEMAGNESRVYFGLLGGGYYDLNSLPGYNKSVQFSYGARFGVNSSQLGDFAKLAFGISYTRGTEVSSGAVSINTNEILAQMLFRKVTNGGLYFGPEAGLNIRTTSGFSTDSTSFSTFEFGALLGYDYYFSPSFSMGPEFHIDRVGSATNSTTVLGTQVSSTVDAVTPFKFLLNLTFHLE